MIAEHPPRIILSPNWRWQRASEIVPPYKPTASDDDWICRASRYMGKKSKATGPALQSVRESFFDLYWADIINEGTIPTSRNNAHSNIKNYIEAMVLARMAPEDIAERIGIDVRVILAYCAMFFDVANRLDQDAFIAAQILEPAYEVMNDAADPEGYILKAIGYFGQREILTSYISHGRFTASSAQLYDELLDTKMRKDSLRTLFQRKITPETYHQPIEQYQTARGQDIENAKVRGVTTDVFGGKEFVGALLEAVKFTVAPIDRRRRVLELPEVLGAAHDMVLATRMAATQEIERKPENENAE